MYPNTIEEHGSFSYSDHRPIIVSSDITLNIQKAFPFRFQNFWCKCHPVDTIITKNWRGNFTGTNMFNFAKKLKTIKHKVKGWSKTHFGNLHDKLAKNTQKINYIEDKLLSNLESFWLNSWLTRLLKQREKMMLFNQKYWGKLRQKEWLVSGDRNTTFSQHKVNTRRKRKLVIKLRDDCGLWIDDHKVIADKITIRAALSFYC